MTEKDIARFKKRLIDERKRIEDDLAGLAEADKGAVGFITDDPVAPDADNLSDSAANLFERDRSKAAEGNVERILAKIERALKKIEEGTYGRSDIDGRPIPIERLEVLPYALTTVDQEDRL